MEPNNEQDKKTRSSENEKKPLRKYLFPFGLCASGILLIGGAFIAQNQLSPATNGQETTQTTASSQQDTNSSRKKAAISKKNTTDSSETRVGESSKDVASSVYDRYGITVTPPSLNSPSNSLLLNQQALQQVSSVVTKPKEQSPNEEGNNSNGGSDIPIPAPVWVNPQLRATSQYAVVALGSTFNAYNYFTVTAGTDQQPKVTISKIDTSISGTQQLNITVSDTSGYEGSITIPIIVNSSPALTVSNSVVYSQIDQPVNVRNYVSASDYEDGNLNDYITVAENVDIHTEGTYSVQFAVKDQYGFTAYDSMTVVITNERPMIHAVDVEHELNQPFNPLEGVTVTDREDGVIDLSEVNVISNTVDVSQEGEYSVTIGNVFDAHGKAADDVTYKVHVVNEAPVIENVDFSLHVFEKFDSEAYLKQLVVKDREDDKLGLSIEPTIDLEAVKKINTQEPGIYDVPVTAVDSNGKETIVVGKIEVLNDAPTLLGVEDKTITQGDEFDPLEGITVEDTEETVSLDNVTVSGEYDVHVPGEYEITLTVQDSFISSTETFTLTVLEKQESLPEEELLEEETPSVEPSNPLENTSEEDTLLSSESLLTAVRQLNK